MKVTMAGAKFSDAIVEVIDTLQNFSDVKDSYLMVIDELTRMVILDTSDFFEDESVAMERLHVLQQIRQDIITLSTTPPEPVAPESEN